MSSKTRILLTDAEIEEQVRQRAYELYEGRGRTDGNALDDWLQAKEEVEQIRQLKATAVAVRTAADTAAKIPEVIKKAVDDALKP